MGKFSCTFLQDRFLSKCCPWLQVWRQATLGDGGRGQCWKRDSRYAGGIDGNELDLRHTGGQHVAVTKQSVNGDRNRIRIHSWLLLEVGARIGKRHPFDVIQDDFLLGSRPLVFLDASRRDLHRNHAEIGYSFNHWLTYLDRRVHEDVICSQCLCQ